MKEIIIILIVHFVMAVSCVYIGWILRGAFEEDMSERKNEKVTPIYPRVN